MLCASPVFAEVPHLIRYQGQAVDSQGVPLEGPYSLTFRLYDAEAAGVKLWEEIQPNVPLSKGHFSVLLGQVTPLDAMDWSVPSWLSVQVNAEPELTPRQRITSVPLALRARQAEVLTQPITPALITPQGAGSGLDADTVDGAHAVDLRARATHTGTQAPATISPQGAGSGLDADMVDGKHAHQLGAQLVSVESSAQITRSGATTWEDLLSTTITTTEGDLLITFSGGMWKESDAPEVFFRARVDATVTQAHFIRGIAAFTLPPLHMTFVVQNVAAGPHTVAIQWKLNRGTVTTAGYYPDENYYRLIVTEIKR